MLARDRRAGVEQQTDMSLALRVEAGDVPLVGEGRRLPLDRFVNAWIGLEDVPAYELQHILVRVVVFGEPLVNDRSSRHLFPGTSRLRSHRDISGGWCCPRTRARA